MLVSWSRLPVLRRPLRAVPSGPLPPPREPGAPYRVCLVCLGNICRSPMAEAVLRASLAEAGLDAAVMVDSAGTGDWHIGQPMYPQAQAALGTRGYDGSAHRARQFRAAWLEGRDLVLAMDAAQSRDLRQLAGPAGPRPDPAVRRRGRPERLGGAEIPDPYGGNDADFDHVLDLLGAAAPVIAARLAHLLGQPAAAPACRGPAATRRRGCARYGARVSRSAAARSIGQLTGLAVREARVAGAQHGYQHLMITLADGRRAFAKVARAAPTPAGRAMADCRPRWPRTSVRSDEVAAAFAAEANSLRWLAEAEAVPVPEVLAVGRGARSSR